MAKEKPYLIAISEEAHHLAQVFSEATGVPVYQVASEAVLYWWDGLGVAIVTDRIERAIYFAENPDASELDFLKRMEMKARPN
ncbi:MAG: hypothetical protein FWD64_04700 [Acidobacteriaceae bacterium]|nr:hypothetical protein [Acidobacteriaceae bacterium]